MKAKNSVYAKKEQPITLIKDQVLSVKGKKLSIECHSGTIWITWPNGHERTLREGQSCSILPKGKVCLTTFKTARIAIHLQSKPGRIPKKKINAASLLRKDRGILLYCHGILHKSMYPWPK
jgi:hypothetical protein